jgi:hypothetical protein
MYSVRSTEYDLTMEQIVGIDLTLLEGEPGIRADILAELGGDFERAPIPEPRSPMGPRRQPLAPAVHRTIFAVDIEGSTRQINATKAQLRDSMYELTDDALRQAGVTEQCREPFVDRGDSLLALIRATDEVPKSAMLDTVVPTLAGALRQHNRRHPAYAFRLRAVVHAGEVHFDGRGQFGESLDVAFRLLDAAEVKRALARTQAPLVLVVSEDIHRSVVIQGYAGIDADGFAPVRLRMAGRTHRGWVRPA